MKTGILKKHIAVFLIISMLFTFFPTSAFADGPFSGGDGSSGNPYLISTADDLASLADFVNAQNGAYNGKSYQVTRDIDLSAIANWTPIGTEMTKSFVGVFDGNHKNITGLKIIDASPCTGLFGYNSGTIKNTNVHGTISVDSNLGIYIYVGGITGVNNGTLESCSYSGSIQVTVDFSYTGGITGRASLNGTIRKCCNMGDISGKFTGGIAGSLHSPLSDCYNTGSVNGSSIGGIAGSVQYGGEISTSYNTGSISGSQAGGITAVINDGSANSVQNCYFLDNINQGVVSGDGSGAIKKTDSELRLQSTYTGFDFINTWTIGSDLSFAYPKLIALEPPPVYNVAFDLNGKSGTSPATQNVGSGDKAVKPGDPHIDGLVFLGWFKEASGINQWDFDADTVTSNTTLYAKWETQNFTVTFNTMGGSAIDPVYSDYGEKITEPAHPLKVGFRFGGWFKEEGCVNAWVFDTDTVTDNIILYANWISNGTSFPGSGTAEDPYGISTPEQLNAVRDYLDANFIMTNDIDISEATSEGGEYWNDGAGWEPIGDSTLPFSGTFDGGGNKIIGLNINRPNQSYIGLFANVRLGKVSNLHIDSFSIIGDNYVGAFAGYSNSTIVQCTANGELFGDAYVGGIIGYSINSISDCTSYGKIEGNGNVGGIVGYNTSSIKDCTNYSIVGALIGIAGGIVGRIDDNITGCHNDGVVYGEMYVGGISGYCHGIIKSCYNTNTIEKALNGITGGITGYLNGTVSQCYNTGTIWGYSSPSTYFNASGGIVGYIYIGGVYDCFNMGRATNVYGFSGIAGGGGHVERCFNAFNFSGKDIYDFIAGHGSYSIDNYYFYEGSDNLVEYAKTYDELCRQDTYVNFDFSTIWRIDEGSHLPVLRDLPFEYTSGLTLDTDTIEVIIGSNTILAPTIFMDSATCKTVIWTSSDENIIKINTNLSMPTTGETVKLHALHSGSATITAKALDGGWFASCNVTVIQPVTSVSIPEASIVLSLGSTRELNATVLPIDATSPTVSWSSSDDTIAAVDQNGKVSAISVGSATITATADGKFDTCFVSIKQPVTSVNLSSHAEIVYINSSRLLTANVSPSDASYPQVTWSSSNTTVATVDQDGNITAVSPGNATITAIADGVSDTCKITVEKKSVNSVALGCTSGTIPSSLAVGVSSTLTATVSPSDATYPQVTWSSSKTAIVTVDQNGKVTAVSPGSATITATADGKSASCDITVWQMKYTIDAESSNTDFGRVFGSGTFNSGDSVTIVAIPAPGGYRFVRWLENGTEVSKSIQYTFVATKNTTLLAEFKAPTPIGINCTKADVAQYGGSTGMISINASGGNSGAYEYSLNNGRSWHISGVFTGLAANTYVVSVRDANDHGLMASCTISINQPALIGIVPANKVPSKAAVDTAITVTPPAVPRSYTVVSVTYSSSNPAVATVDGNGNVTFLAGGKVTIITKVTSQTTDSKGRVKIKTNAIKKKITVKQPVAAISLDITDTTIARKSKVKLTVSIAPYTASNKKLTWKSSNPKVASVSSSGVVTGKVAGTAIISCISQDGSRVSASCTVTVRP